ncbi:MAG TPA: hypothetical protein VFG68_18305 [Fimbriiglobus sp.]|nr:hypothetical protein [Fimbriiglobus sp.]
MATGIGVLSRAVDALAADVAELCRDAEQLAMLARLADSAPPREVRAHKAKIAAKARAIQGAHVRLTRRAQELRTAVRAAEARGGVEQRDRPTDRPGG